MFNAEIRGRAGMTGVYTGGIEKLRPENNKKDEVGEREGGESEWRCRWI